jgi:hypothetical protein
MVNLCHWPPLRSRMTSLTGSICTDMIGGFSCCLNTIVTTCAGSSDIGVTEVGRDPGIGCVAGIALRRGLDVAAGFARRLATVVTGAANASDIGVTEVGRDPGIGCVAGIALCGGLNVTAGFACRLAAVVTGAAGACHVTVIKSCRKPGSGGMTGIALRRGLDMPAGLARRLAAVVTGTTGTGDARMIKPCRTPCLCRMAGVALGGRSNMPAGLALRLAAVVTTAARSDHGRMIYPSYPFKDQGVMAELAIIDGVYVARIFSFRGNSVMTLGTGTSNTTVIEPCRNHGDSSMAIITGITAVNMICRLADSNRTVMAAKTVTGCSLEQSLTMTAGALHHLVGTGQNIPGCKMVELTLTLRGSFNLQTEKKQQNDKKFTITQIFHNHSPIRFQSGFIDCQTYLFH